MPTTAYDAELQRCLRATVGAPDDDIFGQTIQSALDHIEYTPVAHSCAKETSQLGTGELWCNRKAEICAFTGPDPLLGALRGLVLYISLVRPYPETPRDAFEYDTMHPTAHTSYLV